MTDTYLRSLGFAPTQPETRLSRAAFSQSWRYQYDHVARDGSSLFIEHPVGIDSCRLSALAVPLTPQDVFATLSLHDRPGLEASIAAFYAVHGGMGALVRPFVASAFRSYQRER